MPDDQRTLFDDPAEEPGPTYVRGKITTTCKQCGRSIVSYHSQSRVFCSRECAGIHRSETKEGAKPKRGGNTPCPECGEPFYVAPSMIGKRKYCSHACSSKASRRREVFPCQVCGVEVDRPVSMAGKFCSRSCYLKSRRPDNSCEVCNKPLPTQRLRYCSVECFNSVRRQGREKPCETCGKPIYVEAAQKNKRFCSYECHNEAKRIKGPGGRMVRVDGYIAIYYPAHPDASKRGWILEHRLVAEQKYGRRILPTEQIHHLNRDRADNRPENLTILSASAHTAITTRENAARTRASLARLAEYEARFGPLSDG